MSRRTRAKKRENRRSHSEFKVLIYESEYHQIRAWTAKYPNLETGGDLFGLWLDEHTAVVQLVLGPGKQCRRTGASFYQDVEYLERLGNQLTTKEGLCHIGEWHSHHRLGLTRPSGGDENTVWSNMRRYEIHRFCLFIATIGDSSWVSQGVIENQINVDGYLFEIHRQNGSELQLLHSKFENIPENSPFRLSNAEEIRKGAESLNSDKDLELLIKTNSSKSLYFKPSNDSPPKEQKAKEANELVCPVANEELSECDERSFDWLCERLHHYICFLCCGK